MADVMDRTRRREEGIKGTVKPAHQHCHASLLVPRDSAKVDGVLTRGESERVGKGRCVSVMQVKGVAPSVTGTHFCEFFGCD